MRQRWLITYTFRQHERGEGALMTDTAGGRRTEVIDQDPFAWFIEQTARWTRLQDPKSRPGKAMSDIVMLLAVPSK